MRLARVPAGRFVMGGSGEGAETSVVIAEPFWMGACEVTNEQFGLFDPEHDSRYYQKRHARSDDRGLPLDGARQPVVRVSWERAMAFCAWLSSRTGLRFTLPTEVQWEYACRAGTATPLYYGSAEQDFSRWGNMGDLSFAGRATKQERLAWEKGRAPQVTGGLEHLAMEGAALADVRFNDGAVVTAAVGSYQANAWGLYDMHGNAGEWTRTAYVPQTCGGDTGQERKVVRGGSFFDPPARCGSAVRIGYPVWQRVFNVGFRVVCEGEIDGRKAFVSSQ
jgi:formylglycine-generating enzyme required for sulfatase activity